MSIHSLMTRAARSETQTKSPTASTPLQGNGADVAAGAGNGADRTGGDQSVAAVLASRIPSEAIAVYTSALAFLVPDKVNATNESFTGRWILAAVVAVLAVLYAVGTYRHAVLADPARTFRWPVWKTATVVVAFAAWVLVIPGSPFGEFSWYSAALGAIVGLIVNAFLGAVALFVDGD